MNELWLGRRTQALRFQSAEDVSTATLVNAAASMTATREVHEARMAETLARVIARARRSPIYAREWSRWESIQGLDDLTAAPCMSSNVLPTMSEQAIDWSQWVNSDETVVGKAATGGSTGTSKVMPFTQWSLEIFAQSSLPFLAKSIAQFSMPRRRAALALTAPPGYVTYLAIPQCLMAAGFDVLHVPLSSVLNEPAVALDLIDWLLARDNAIHAISTVTAMLPLLISALESHPRGVEAVDRMRESLQLLFTGGSELTPTLEALLSNRLGLQNGAYLNVFASTEAGISACSGDDFSLFSGSLHSHVLTLLPMNELERADGDPTYQPKGVLLTRAPVGLVGELACTFDAAIPWINLRQGDVFEVADARAGADYPSLRYLSRASSVQDVGGGRIWPSAYERAMASLHGTVTDFLAMALKPGDPMPDSTAEIRDRDALLFYFEGSASIREVTNAIFDAIPMLETTGPKLGLGTYDMLIFNVRTGALRRCRQRKSQERGGSPGPLKHKVVRGPQYRVPDAEVIAKAFGWSAVPRHSEIRLSPNNKESSFVADGDSAQLGSATVRGRGSPG